MTDLHPVGSVSDAIFVDDNVLTLELVKLSLRGTDYDVRYFSDEIEALEFLESHETRMLVVDNRMPRVDGLEVLRRLHENGGIRAHRIYLCSAADPPRHICEEAKNYGAVVLSKESLRMKEQLVALISECISQARSGIGK